MILATLRTNHWVPGRIADPRRALAFKLDPQQIPDLPAPRPAFEIWVHAPTVEGVTLSSLHSAKGLEWDAVFLVGLAEGTLPTNYARTGEAIEEERRLLYVGVTRARHTLWLSYAGARSPMRLVMFALWRNDTVTLLKGFLVPLQARLCWRSGPETIWG